VRHPKEEIDMAAAVHELSFNPRRRIESDPKEIVAVVLADGSVRDLRAEPDARSDRKRYATGSISGPDWILWWDRRSMAS
jgi:hypothetical protein